jgi:hypothetical protein
VGYNFAFWPKIQIGLLLALISLPPRPGCCLPRVRPMSPKAWVWHPCTERTSPWLPRVPLPLLAIAAHLWTPSCPRHSPSTPACFPSLALALPLALAARALGPHGRSHVHHRLHLIVLHLIRTRAEAVAAELTVPACRRPCSPPEHVARRPRATSRRSSATHRCALASSCFPTTSPTMAWPPSTGIRELRRPSSVLVPSGTSRDNSTKRRGLSAEAKTHVNSATRTVL